MRVEILEECRTAGGVENMALDEALLLRAIDENVGHFRLYRWARPTISLGYFQDDVSHQVPEELRGLDRVRRLSGGGAILHHHEITYSCSLPPENPWSHNPSKLYEDMHSILRDCLAHQGFDCWFRGVPKTFAEGEPFLCYSRGDERDLVHLEHKIVGSAQRRRRGAILQHGSLLLKQSEYAKQFPGVQDLMPEKTLLNMGELSAEVVSRVSTLFGNSIFVKEFSGSISTCSERLSREKYRYSGKRFERS